MPKFKSRCVNILARTKVLEGSFMSLKLVKKQESLAKISLVLCMALADKLRPLLTKYPLTVGHVSDLAGLVWPKERLGWSPSLLAVRRLGSALLLQYPWLGEISVDNLSDSTFDQWVADQAKIHGEWLKIAPAIE